MGTVSSGDGPPPERLGEAPVAACSAALPEISMEEIKKHSTKKDTWIIIDGKVYDLNKDSPLKGSHSNGEEKFLTDHPGGKKILIMQGGKDATEVFKEFHSKSILDKYGEALCIGIVKN